LSRRRAVACTLSHDAGRTTQQHLIRLEDAMNGLPRVASAAALAFAISAPAIANDTCKLPNSGNTSFATGSWGTRTAGSGNITEQVRSASGYSFIKVQGPFAVDARPADRERVTVRIDDNLQSMVEVGVTGNGTLEVRPTRNAAFITRSVPTVIVEYVKLSGLAVEGSGDAIAANLRPAESFRAVVAGSGDVCLSGVRTARLDIAVAGSGDVRAIGASDEVTVKISGSGDVAAQSLVGRSVKVSIAGSGDVKVNAMETLDVSIAGSGDVRYLGTPKIKRNVAGSGSVKSL
jgi:hypothetical protein